MHERNLAFEHGWVYIDTMTCHIWLESLRRDGFVGGNGVMSSFAYSR
jgi:hypothetical protein